MKSVLFVCLGNICRSPMAEAVFNRILENNHKTADYCVDSAGLIAYHKGELPDSRMRFHAAQRNYHLTHISRPFNPNDFDKFDIILAMDDQNFDGLIGQATTFDKKNKIYKMANFCRNLTTKHIPDPYCGGEQGFENVIDLLEDACEGLFRYLEE